MEEREMLIQELKDVASKTKNTPSRSQFAKLSDVSTARYVKEFKGWTAAVVAAGMVPNKKGNRPMSDIDVLNEIKNLKVKVGRWPLTIDYEKANVSSHTVINKFGSLEAAYQKIDATYKNKLKISDDDIIKDLKELGAKFGKISKRKYEDVGKYSVAALKKHFGSFNEAKEAAGLNVTQKYNVSDITRQDLIDELKNMWSNGINPITLKIVDTDSCKYGKERFSKEGFNSLMEEAGVPQYHTYKFIKDDMTNFLIRAAKELNEMPNESNVKQLKQYFPPIAWFDDFFDSFEDAIISTGVSEGFSSLEEVHTCSDCQETKAKGQFHKRTAGKKGVEALCVECRAEDDKHRAEGYKERRFEINHSPQTIAKKKEVAARPESKAKKKIADDRRKAIKLNVHIEDVDIQVLLKIEKGICHYCKFDICTKPDISRGVYKATIDHVISYDKGGFNCYDNCVAACGSCNYSKSNRNYDEFVRSIHLKKIIARRKTKSDEI